MIGVPSLYATDPRTRKLIDQVMPLPPRATLTWVGMEMMGGAEVRLTIRNHICVRVEAIRRPSAEQKLEGITTPWFMDVQRLEKAGYWLWFAVDGTDLSQVPDGEWIAEAIGENINNNPYGIEGHTVLFSSLFPWRESMPGVPVPPALEKTPVDYDDLRLWLATTPSSYEGAEGRSVPMAGVVWWLHETPYAQVRAKDFPPLLRAPNPNADLPEGVMDLAEITNWDSLVEDA